MAGSIKINVINEIKNGLEMIETEKNYNEIIKKNNDILLWRQGETRVAFASVAQSVEQRIRNAQVMGSSPIGSSTKKG